MPETLEIDDDAIATMPINRLAVLRADAREAIAARDAIDDCFSPEWAAAHEEALAACERAYAEQERLAKNPKTRHGSWRTPADVELIVLGYL
ncbi:MAG TPA: hypothetical protein VLE97_10900 [Gaiellaceae bacterium]|nr:hypothetical protein [Gaiellaceae bacterium]